jgi:Tat protein translocase TatC
MTERSRKEEGEEDLATMTFAEHLEELRRRIIVSLVAVGAFMFLFLFQKDAVMAFVFGPYDSMWARKAEDWRAEQLTLTAEDLGGLPAHIRESRSFLLANWDRLLAGDRIPGVDLEEMARQVGFKLPRQLVSITPLQDFLTFMSAAILCAIAIASPIVLHQMWRFIGAGLYRRERRAVLWFLPPSIGLFAAGMAFGYLFMVPYALYFLYGLSGTTWMLTVRDYFRFLFVLTIALGCVFQLPVVMVGLTRLGITTPRTYTRQWRQWILAIFVVAAVLTPPDPFTQLLMAGPMIGLYVLGVVLSKAVHRKQALAPEPPA